MFTPRDESVCPECGAEVDPSARFCDQCKAPLSKTGATTRLSEHVSHIYPEPPEPPILARRDRNRMVPTRRRILPSWVVPGVIAIVLIGAGIGIGSFMRRNPPSATTNVTAQATGVPIAAACIVPEVVGQDQGAATGLIAGLGLQPVKTTAYDPSIPTGAIVSQQPSGGTQAKSCTDPVTIVVSLGPAPEPTSIPPTETPIPPTDVPTPIPPTPTLEPTIPPTPEPTATLEATPTPEPTPTPQREVGDTLYEADWSSGLNGWGGSSDWAAVSGMIISNGNTSLGESLLVAPYKPEGIADYAVEAEIQVVRNNGGCLIVSGQNSSGIAVRISREGGYFASIGGDEEGCNSYTIIFDWDGNRRLNDLENKHFSPSKDWSLYRVEVKANSIRILVDGVLLIETTDNQHLEGGQIGLWSNHVAISVRSFKVIKL